MTMDKCIVLNISQKEQEIISDLVWMCREHKLEWEDVVPLIIDGDGATDGMTIIHLEKE